MVVDGITSLELGVTVSSITVEVLPLILDIEAIFNDVERVVEDGFLHEGEGKNCPTYIIENINSTDKDTMIINFGNG